MQAVGSAAVKRNPSDFARFAAESGVKKHKEKLRRVGLRVLGDKASARKRPKLSKQRAAAICGTCRSTDFF